VFQISATNNRQDAYLLQAYIASDLAYLYRIKASILNDSA
jgi:hypothetical protein